MAEYTEVADISSYYMGYDPTASDFCNEEDVEKWISEKSVLIDMALRRKYTLPIVNENDLVFLKTLTEKFVVAVIDDIMRMDAEADKDESLKYIRSRNYGKEADSLLQSIMNGTMILESSQRSLKPISYRRSTSV